MKDFPNRYIWNDKSSEDFTKRFLNPNIKNKLDTFLKDEIMGDICFCVKINF
jgi:hypothetical protein